MLHLPNFSGTLLRITCFAWTKYLTLGSVVLALPGVLLAVDSDGDGLDDSVETNTGIYVSRSDTGTNPLVADTDGDGVGDWYEVATVEDDPANVQTNAPNDPTVFTNRPYPIPEPDATPVATNQPVKVYILSGQSNMQGYGETFGDTSGTLATITRTEGKFPQLLDGVDFRARADVKARGVVSTGGDGPLEPVGFGSSSNRFGPELGFGYVMADYHDEPVLLIKSSQGGKSLGFSFLPPGSSQYEVGSNTYAGYGDSPPSWTTGTTPTPTNDYAGEWWDLCFYDESDWAPAGTINSSITNVTDVLDNFATEYPEWAAQGFEIAGFVWWQGYNDRQGSSAEVATYAARYEQNMVRFIEQIRDYYESRYPTNIAPDAPFVLATVATTGWDGNDTNTVNVINGQLAVDGDAGNYPGFAGNVKTMEARGFLRESSESPNNNNQGHHYYLNAETYMLAGDALGRAMLDLKQATATDTKAPEILSLDPPAEAPDFRVNANLSLTFNETIQIGSGGIILKNLSDGTQTTIPATDASQVSVAGYKLTIDPSSDLTPNKTYAIRIASGAIEDSSGNDFAGINDDTTWTFDTIPADVTAPPAPVISFPTGAIKANQITLEVSPVVDPEDYGVEYLFKNLTLGTDSGWKVSTSWVDTGLDLGTNYVYAVQARDTSPSFNESADSPQRSARTLAEAPSVKVADTFISKQDFAPSDDQSDTGGATKPITIDTTGFQAAGTDKLVGIISLHNSAAGSSQLTSLSYAGVDVFQNLIVAATGSFYTRQYIFYLDNPTADGDLILGFETSNNIDEVSVVLFALNDVLPGFKHAASQSGNPDPVDVLEGDFVVGVGQRNNQSQTIENAPPYTVIDIESGNLVGLLGHLVADSDMTTAPVFGNTSILSSIVAFEAAAPDVPQVVVPDVVGLAEATAESSITAADLLVGTKSSAFSDSVASGNVVSQSPSSGSVVDEFSAVNLVISLGPVPPTTVPDVVGLAEAIAESDITAANLVVGTKSYENNASVASGNVISQTPSGGATADEGTGVNLVISLGPVPQTTVPDVVGFALAAAQSSITGANLVVGTVTYQPDATVPSGDVISQDPTGGTTANEGSSVNLVVSEGAGGEITIADIFSFKGDLAPDPTYSSVPGSDGGFSDLYGVDKPLTIPVSNFTSAGSDKLVGVLALHNSAPRISAITGLSYGGVDVFSANTILYRGAGGFLSHIFFFLDEPEVDGNLVISLDTEYNVDEVGLVLFALKGTEPGYLEFDNTGDAASPSLTVSAGDFLVGAYQRNNAGNTVSAPFTELDLQAGNMAADVAYLIPDVGGSYQPVYSGGAGATGVISSLVSFAAASPVSVSGYAAWADTNAPTTGEDPLGDEDGDGVDNYIEFIVGGTSGTNDIEKLPTVEMDGGNMTFSFERSHQSIGSGITTSVEAGSDLSAWPDNVYSVPDGATVGPPITVEKDSSPGYDRITMTLSTEGIGRAFARLKASAAP